MDKKNGEYKEHVGENVYLLLDARKAELDEATNSNIGIAGRLTKETETNVKLEDVIGGSSLVGIFYSKDGNFKKATINKKYIIGIFEK